MSSDTDTLKNIQDGKPVRIFLPIKERTEHLRAQCVFHPASAPQFALTFKPGVLPEEDLDPSQTCIVSIDMGGPTVSLEAKILSVENDQTLSMTLLKSISHEQMREFFRVDAVTDIISESFHTEVVNAEKDPWSLEGKTIDISGSGILAVFESRPPVDKQSQLVISVPFPEPTTVTVLASKIRSRELPDGRHEVAYHFEDISTEDRDKIIGCCLIIQRKLLRLKVQVKDL